LSSFDIRNHAWVGDVRLLASGDAGYCPYGKRGELTNGKAMQNSVHGRCEHD